MRYYELKQDRTLRNLIEIEGFEGCPNIVMDRERAGTFRRCAHLFVHGDEKSQYPDFFQAPVLMISEKLYEVIRYYDTSVIYNLVVLADIKRRRQDVYRLMMPEIIEADSEGTVPEVPIHHRIFYIKQGIEHHLIVAEDVLESMLARASVGITYEETDLRKWGKSGV